MTETYGSLGFLAIFLTNLQPWCSLMPLPSQHLWMRGIVWWFFNLTVWLYCINLVFLMMLVDLWKEQIGIRLSP